MDIITKTEGFWSEKAIGAVISIIKESKDSIEAERKIQRGIHTEIHLGTAETNHRFYSYRMKHQGRSWSSEGMAHMVWVLTARKNKTLTQALLYHASGKSYKKMDRAMHKAAAQAERKIPQGGLSAAQKRKMRGYRPGCLEGRIGAYCSSSSSISALAHAIQNY